MAEVLLFHHALGQTSGFLAFADELRRAGHTVHTPDLYDGRTFQTLNDGIAYAEEIGFGNVIERGVRVADDLPDELVYAGFSLGVLPAQKLAQTRPGARGALLFYSCVPVSEFGSSWPADVPVHGRRPDLHGRGRRGCRPGNRRVRPAGRTVPVPGGPALLCRFQPAVVRPGSRGAARQAGTRLPRHPLKLRAA